MCCQKLIASGNVETLVETAEGLSNEHRNQLSRFLETKSKLNSPFVRVLLTFFCTEMYELALEITRDDELKFELALMLNKTDIALAIAGQYQQDSMWTRIGDTALEAWKVGKRMCLSTPPSNSHFASTISPNLHIKKQTISAPSLCSTVLL